MAHSQPIEPVISISQILATLRKHRLRWILPAVAVWAAVGSYVAFKSDNWEAAQGLILRNDASNNIEAPGKFRQNDEMKATQETILEVASSSGVLKPALVAVGPPENYKQPAAWPTDEDITDLRSALKLGPPKGAEFGKTEVFYVRVQDKNRRRAINLVESLCNELQRSLAQLRSEKATSILDELSKAESLARIDLDQVTERLANLEKEIPGDLAELRMLHQSPSGDSDLKRTLTEVQAELRRARTSEKSNDELLKVLLAAQRDAGALLAAPNALLESQPTLKRLKDGLTDAQLRTATLSGSMKDDHPLVAAAKQGEQVIHKNIVSELEVAIRGVRSEADLNNSRLAVIHDQMDLLNARLDQLAKMRASYSTVANEAEHRRYLHEEAVRKLSDARSSLDTAKTVQLLGRIDRPDTGPRPLPPGRKTIMAAGLIGGLLAGLGLVFLTVPLPRPTPPPIIERAVHPATNGHARPQHVDSPLTSNGNGAGRALQESSSN